MDTVYNHQEGPYIQTFIFENTGFMIGRLKQHKTSEEMSSSLNYFQEFLGDDMYQKLFGLLLTDRGSEFAKPQLLEVNTETGEIRSNIFYCNAQMPSQKPHVENNHEFIRDIILKKKSMSNLTQYKLDLMFSHINSVPRKSLGGKTPYEAFEFFYGKDTLFSLLYFYSVAFYLLNHSSYNSISIFLFSGKLIFLYDTLHASNSFLEAILFSEFAYLSDKYITSFIPD